MKIFFQKLVRPTISWFREFANIMLKTNHTGHDEDFWFLRVDVQLHCGVFAVHLSESVSDVIVCFKNLTMISFDQSLIHWHTFHQQCVVTWSFSATWERQRREPSSSRVSVVTLNMWGLIIHFYPDHIFTRQYHAQNAKSSPQASGPSHQATLACPPQPEVLESVLGHFLSYFTWILYVPSSYSLTVLLSTIFLSYFTCISYVHMLVLSLS